VSLLYSLWRDITPVCDINKAGQRVWYFFEQLLTKKSSIDGSTFADINESDVFVSKIKH